MASADDRAQLELQAINADVAQPRYRHLLPARLPLLPLWEKVDRRAAPRRLRGVGRIAVSAKLEHPTELRSATFCRLRLWELPCAVQNLRAWPIEPHHVVPAGHHRQAIGNLAIASSS